MFRCQHLFSIVLLSFLLCSLSSCKKEGCTDSQADNYNTSAEVDDGSCVYTYDDQTEKFVATINGSSFSASFFSAVHENGQYVVSGTDDGLGLSLSLADSISNGSLDSSSANYVVTGGQESANSGSYSYTISNDQIVGTFNFETNSHSITTGQFRVPL